MDKLNNNNQKNDKSLSANDVENAAFVALLEKGAFEEAIDYLSKFGDLLELPGEEQLITAFVENKMYAEAERYVMGKIQASKDYNITVRQVRYLGEINPMMCRFMLGNLPAKVEARDMVLYYKDFAIAQSKIGMINSSEITLLNIDDSYTKVIYLANLLNSLVDEEVQLSILEKAISILESANLDDSSKIKLYTLLSKSALIIYQKELSKSLYQIAQDLS